MMDLFSSKAQVSEEEIKEYYQNNIKRYTVPAQAELYIIDEQQGPVDQIWADVAVGKPFQQVVKEHLSHPVQPVEAPINHLDPEVRDVVNKLINGETSQIFEAQGVRVIVHLVERTPETQLSLQKVKETVRSEMRRQRFNKARSEYIQALKAQTQIEINDRQWQSVQKELGGA